MTKKGVAFGLLAMGNLAATSGIHAQGLSQDNCKPTGERLVTTAALLGGAVLRYFEGACLTAQCQATEFPYCGAGGMGARVEVESGGKVVGTARASKITIQVHNGSPVTLDTSGRRGVRVNLQSNLGPPVAGMAPAWMNSTTTVAVFDGTTWTAPAPPSACPSPIPQTLAAKRSCDGLNVGDCRCLAEIYERGTGTTADPVLASSLYYTIARSIISRPPQPNCNLVICTEADKQRQFDDRLDASIALTKACDLKLADACVALGVSYETGDGVAQDGDRARNLYRSGCEAGAAQGCYNLGQLYFKANDLQNGMPWFQRGCDAGEVRSCDVVGYACVEQAGEAGDATTRAASAKCATEALTKACDGRFPKSCVTLGTALIRGTLDAPNQRLAGDFFRKACTLGNSAYCAPEPTQAVRRERRSMLDRSCGKMDVLGHVRSEGPLPPAAYMFMAGEQRGAATANTLGCALPGVVVGAVPPSDLSNMGPLAAGGGRSIWCCP
jgi:TPR repeat protein